MMKAVLTKNNLFLVCRMDLPRIKDFIKVTDDVYLPRIKPNKVTDDVYSPETVDSPKTKPKKVTLRDLITMRKQGYEQSYINQYVKSLPDSSKKDIQRERKEIEDKQRFRQDVQYHKNLKHYLDKGHSYSDAVVFARHPPLTILPGGNQKPIKKTKEEKEEDKAAMLRYINSYTAEYRN